MLYPHLMPRLTAIANFGAVSLPQLLNVAPWLMALVVVELILLVLYVLEKKDARRQDALSDEA